MTLREAISRAAERLSLASDTPRLDAEILAAHAMGIDRNSLLLGRLDDPAPVAFDALIARRLATEPVAYIIGRQDFWSLSLKVAPGVLIPRPDSETLIEAALDFFQGRPPAQILDLGTGSGALLLAALSEWPNAHGLGVDQSRVALSIATENADQCGLASRAEFSFGDWGQGVTGPFDLILCNPPYIATGYALHSGVADYEPQEALFSGQHGLDDYKRLAPQIGALLGAGGCACIEIGFDQAETAGQLFASAGFAVEVRQDLAGRDRCLRLTITP